MPPICSEPGRRGPSSRAVPTPSTRHSSRGSRRVASSRGGGPPRRRRSSCSSATTPAAGRGRPRAGHDPRTRGGFEPEPGAVDAGEGLTGAIAAAVAEADLAPSEIAAVVLGRASGARAARDASGSPGSPAPAASPPRTPSARRSAPRARRRHRRARRREAGCAILVLDVCASGHVARSSRGGEGA
jgi:hypothetical protein